MAEQNAVLDPETRDRLRFIHRAQTLGFHLQEIAELLSLHARPEADSAAVKTIAEARLADIEQKIADLQRMHAGLSAITQRCAGHGTTRQCPILSALCDEPRPSDGSR